MNYTTNYHLPQWVEEDRIFMEDFNEAMENIDEGLSGCYGADNPATAVGWFTLGADTPLGTTMATFDFTPSFVVVSMGTTAVIPQGQGGYIICSYNSLGQTATWVDMSLSGQKLIYGNSARDVTLPQKCAYAAFR